MASTNKSQVTDRSRRAAIYARVSSEEQVQGYSIDAQLRAGRDYCSGQGWEVIEEYVDKGKSARTDNIAKRPAFRQMLEDAAAHHFEVLIVHKLDRFSRNRRITDDCLNRLYQAGVGFISLTENMDFSTPQGQMMLGVLSSLAQFYSDNLSQETKKGKGERKKQGMYNGLLPFGVTKGEDGVPVADAKELVLDGNVASNYLGLVLAFEACAGGKSDANIAVVLNSLGYRTTGNRGRNLFTKATVRVILRNRFYLGELPDGQGGWMDGKHSAILDQQLWDSAQEVRAGKATGRNTVRSDARRSSLSGLGRCFKCGSNIRIYRGNGGKARLVCSKRVETRDCQQPTVYLHLIEEQLERYLAIFHIPPDYQKRILDAYRALDDVHPENGSRRKTLEGHLERLKKLYQWGDLAEQEYLAQRDEFARELRSISVSKKDNGNLDRLAQFLADISKAWAAATQEQRNDLAKQLFIEVWVDNDKVVAVTPRPEFEPFFELNHDTEKVLHWRKRRDSNPRSQP